MQQLSTRSTIINFVGASSLTSLANYACNHLNSFDFLHGGTGKFSSDSPNLTRCTKFYICLVPRLLAYTLHINTYTARPVCWSGWISDSYCSLKPLLSGMGEVVPARTSPTLLPPSPRTVLSSCFKVSQCINRRD